MRVTTALLLLTLAAPLAAQQPATPATSEKTETTAATSTAATATTTAAGEQEPDAERRTRDAYELREIFTTTISRSSPELRTILVADPSLLADDAFLGRYPELKELVEKYPQVRRNPRFYLVEFDQPRKINMAREVIEMISVGFIFLLIVTSSAWLIRTVIEQRRWSRLSKTQAEVHNKILDRFGTSSEVLEYIKTPAGTKFLESAPIPLHTEPAWRQSPVNRIALTIQIGVVVAAAALGMLIVSLRLSGEGSEGMFALGVIAFFIGAGFIASAAVSVMVSRKLGITGEEPVKE